MRELSEAEIQEVLRSERVGHLAVCDGDVPYVSPLSFVYTDGVVVFRTMEGRRIDAIRRHPRVSLSVSRIGTGAADWSSVLIVGDATIVEDRSVSSRYVALIMAKYRAAYGVMDAMPDWILDPRALVVLVDPTEISGRAAGDTRPGRVEIPRRT
ncbi:MAG TPA: pyridoxamine 5'-phosphate oxidase family protein [Acidimicrobiia bacterium]|jgi:nitroimidazol reductase NimA-like FMN-containing flavoprotein (pyridoxamine 5'-phosphate oxidase superfamily)|nr:pyridoxamine 5'-phosphate oxidase family protein [Acidimicrobiia bacterium]